MDAVTNLKSAVVELDSNQSILSRYADSTPARFSRGMTEEVPFTSSESQTISETIQAMRDLQASMPLPINWALFGKVKPHVDQRRKELREQADPIVRRCVLIRVSYTGFFSQVRDGEVVTTPSEMIAAAFEAPDLANEVVRDLKKLGTESRIEMFGAFRRKSTMTHSLIELGFEPAAIGGPDGTN
jgi:hypothetical protein